MRRSRRKISWSVRTRSPTSVGPIGSPRCGGIDESAIQHADRRAPRATGCTSSSFSSSSRRSAWPSLSQRMIVGIPSRTTRRSRLMSRSIASGGESGKTTSRARARVGHRRGDACRTPRASASVASGGSNSSSRARRVLAATAREVDVVLRLVPRALQLRLDVRARRAARRACPAATATTIETRSNSLLGRR